MVDEMMENKMEELYCPYCKFNGETFETAFSYTYCGAYPHIGQYTCPSCGIAGPIGSGFTKKEAMENAFRELGKFLKWISNSQTDKQ